MTGFIKGVCKKNRTAHTKVGQCSMFEGTPMGFIIHNEANSFSLDEAIFNTEIKDAITALGIKRITPLLGGVTDYQPTGGDVRTSQEGFGPEIPIGINAKRVDYIINEGGLCLLQQLKKLNGSQIRILPVDKNKIAYGTVASIDDVDKFRGFLATIWATKRDNTGSQTGAIIFSVFYSANYENEEDEMAAMALTEKIEGLTGVVLKKTSSGKAQFVISCSGEDLTETYGSTLAVAALYKKRGGGQPTSVTYATETNDITFLPVGEYMIADAEALNTAGIEGLEGEDTYTNLA